MSNVLLTSRTLTLKNQCQLRQLKQVALHLKPDNLGLVRVLEAAVPYEAHRRPPAQLLPCLSSVGPVVA